MTLEQIPGCCDGQYREWCIISHTISNFAGNEYSSKLQKELKFEVECTSSISYFLVSPLHNGI